MTAAAGELPPHGLNVALLQPQIAPNTGNVGRLCVATGTPLHLVRPLGFVLSDQKLKRSAMDYWPRLKLTVHDDTPAFLAAAAGAGGGQWFFSTTGTVPAWRVEAVLASRVALYVERMAAPLQAPGVDPELAQHPGRARRDRAGVGRESEPRNRLGLPRRSLRYARTLPTRPPSAPPAPTRAPPGRIGTSGKGEPRPGRPTPRP